MIGAPHEWADGNCPTCKGRGAILERADTEKDINAMFADFRKKMACPK
jgi:predicted DCC family thiol-disulfide oxidoreductase YuxK